MLIVTTNELPGYTITHVLGEVFGIAVRRLGLASMFSGDPMAAFNLNNNEVPQLTKLVLEGRNHAMQRLMEAAWRQGGNAILGMRFDNAVMHQGVSEICAYGTAVWAEPATDEARAQYGALVAARRVPPEPPRLGS